MPDWTEALNGYRGQEIAVYGLGNATQEVLGQLQDHFRIIGLLDSFCESGILYGYPILSIQQAISFGVKCIVVAARPGSCRAIERRIGEQCRQCKIALVDMRGNDLLLEQAPVYSFKGCYGRKKTDLLSAAETYDWISFDMFDTLVVRQTLFFTDFLELVCRKLKQNGIVIENFAERRIACEKEMSRGYVPTLTEIYRRLSERYDLPYLDCSKAAMIEWTTDMNILVPREEIRAILDNFVKQGKKVFIITDSYYDKKQIQEMLRKCKIDGYTDVLISSEYRMSKSNGLFSVWKKQINNGSALHIGDDLSADIESAKKYGIVPYHIYSSLALFEKTGYLGLKNELDTWSSRMRIGLFITKLFNSPFQFERENNSISVNCASDVGYLFFAPFLSDFVMWLAQRIHETGIQQILFAARDGYIIKKMYDMLGTGIQTYYFLTSRTAMIRAGMENEEDIKLVEDMHFSGSLEEQLSERFGIEEPLQNDNKQKKYLTDYQQDIFKRSALMKKNYKVYLEALNLKQKETAFFDFVSKGTCQFFLDRMLSKPIRGFYCMRLEADSSFAENLEIQTFYEQEEVEGSEMYQNYYLFETILTSSEPSVVEFDKSGAPIFEAELRDDREIANMEQVQSGIFEYWNKYCELFWHEDICICKQIDEKLLSLIHKIGLDGNPFLNLKVQDPFFHRTTQVTDLL